MEVRRMTRSKAKQRDLLILQNPKALYSYIEQKVCQS